MTGGTNETTGRHHRRQHGGHHGRQNLENATGEHYRRRTLKEETLEETLEDISEEHKIHQKEDTLLDISGGHGWRPFPEGYTQYTPS
jgi:trimethylamine:corrinoid methyltransferase-like protein